MCIPSFCGATLILALGLSACSGGGGSAGPGNVAGTYGLIYSKVGGSCGGSLDPAWVAGILNVSQNGEDLTLNFGTTYVVSATIDGSGVYTFDQPLTDGSGLTNVRGQGVFTDVDIQSAEGNSSAEAGIAATYDNGGSPCVVYGSYYGNKTISTAGT